MVAGSGTEAEDYDLLAIVCRRAFTVYGAHEW